MGEGISVPLLLYLREAKPWCLRPPEDHHAATYGRGRFVAHLELQEQMKLLGNARGED
jgi:hypothetical protein